MEVWLPQLSVVTSSPVLGCAWEGEGRRSGREMVVMASSRRKMSFWGGGGGGGEWECECECECEWEWEWKVGGGDGGLRSWGGGLRDWSKCLMVQDGVVVGLWSVWWFHSLGYWFVWVVFEGCIDFVDKVWGMEVCVCPIKITRSWFALCIIYTEWGGISMTYLMGKNRNWDELKPLLCVPV